MSDYLSNLLARSFNQIEVIQPLLPSRFEPLQQSGEPLVEQFLELEREDRALPSLRVSPSSPRQPPKSSPQPQPLRADLNPPTQSIATDVDPPTPPEQQLAPKPIDQQLLVEQISVPVETSSAADPRFESYFVSQWIGPHQRPPAIQPQIVSWSESVASSVPTAKPKPPTIQVTIGRVEVRAIVPPSPPRQSTKPPTPNLSLEDYLRSGNGGKG